MVFGAVYSHWFARESGSVRDLVKDHVTLRGLTIRDVGPEGNRDGVKLSGLDNFRVENCLFERWGDNGSAIDMVGCHEGVVSDCVFSNNLIAFRSDETRSTTNIGGGTAPDTFKFTHNHWYCLDRPDRSSRLSLPVKEAGGSYGTDPQFVNREAGEFRLKDTSPVRDAGVRSEEGGRRASIHDR